MPQPVIAGVMGGAPPQQRRQARGPMDPQVWAPQRAAAVEAVAAVAEESREVMQAREVPAERAPLAITLPDAPVVETEQLHLIFPSKKNPSLCKLGFPSFNLN